MRRFIVIFLLLLLPIQILAESLEDLRTTHHVSLVDVVDAASTDVNAAAKHSRSSPDAPNLQQAAHADISDSVSSVALYVHSTLSVGLWPVYRSVAFPTVYLPVIKPPLI